MQSIIPKSGQVMKGARDLLMTTLRLGAQGGSKAPSHAILDSHSSQPKTPAAQPGSTKFTGDSPTDRLTVSGFSSDNPTVRNIAQQVLLAKTLTPPSGSRPPTFWEMLTRQALTDPLSVPKQKTDHSNDMPPKTSQNDPHISQVLSRVDHDDDIRAYAADVYSFQPMQHPLSSGPSRALHTMADKSSRRDVHQVESSETVKAHLDKFRRDGVACFIPGAARERFCTTHLGHAGDNAQFVLNKAQMDIICKIVGREGGTQAEMETRLEELCGIDKGSWKNLSVAVYKEKNPDKIGLRFVSGKEELANPKYGAGGVTRGGMDEAIVNRVSVDEVTFVPIMKYISDLMKT